MFFRKGNYFVGDLGVEHPPLEGFVEVNEIGESLPQHPEQHSLFEYFELVKGHIVIRN